MTVGWVGCRPQEGSGMKLFQRSPDPHLQPMDPVLQFEIRGSFQSQAMGGSPIHEIEGLRPVMSTAWIKRCLDESIGGLAPINDRCHF
jgi:hypothetical protein